MCQHKNLYTNVHSGTIHHGQKGETTSMSTRWWMDTQKRSIHTMEYYSAIRKNDLLIHTTTWMNLRNVVLSERTQTKKATCCVIPFIWNIQNRQIHKDGEWVSGCQGLGEGEGEWLWMRTGFLFGGDENVLVLNSGDFCTTLWMY